MERQGARVTATITKPDFPELVRVCTRIGFLSFGGPAGQIALMHRELADERKLVSEEQLPAQLDEPRLASCLAGNFIGDPDFQAQAQRHQSTQHRGGWRA